MTERAEKRSCSPHDASLTHKVGRPSTSGDSSRPKRTFTKKPKDKICVFSPCSYEAKEDLRRLTTSKRGETLLDGDDGDDV